jgi:opacity protein-like surface antigen
MQMKKILFTAAGTTLMAGAAMAQAVVPTPTPNVTGPTSTIVTTNSSTLVTGLDNSTWSTGAPGFVFASPTVIAIPPGTTATSQASLAGGGQGAAGNDGGQN